MDFFEVVYNRRSIRKYKNEPIDIKLLEKAIDSGRWAASARAEYPWKFVLLTDRKRIDELQTIVGNNGAFLRQAAAAIIVICKDTKYYLEDGCAATQNILLALHALSLGGCWIAGDKKPYDKEVLKFINVQDNYKLVSIISVGIPDEKPVKKKPDLKEVLYMDKMG